MKMHSSHNDRPCFGEFVSQLLLFFGIILNAQPKAGNKLENVSSFIENYHYREEEIAKQETKKITHCYFVLLLSQNVNFVYKKSQGHCFFILVTI